MKTKDILTGQQYMDAFSKHEDRNYFQNMKGYYIIMGTCGATIVRVKDMHEKHINNWIEYCYIGLCKVFDGMKFIKN